MQPNKFFLSQSYPFQPFQYDDWTESERPSKLIALALFINYSDRPSRIKIDRPSHQIPNTAMILPRAIALHTKYQIDVCGTIKVKLMINLLKINTIN
ncbi:MAG TPA: hypothetical protein VIQ31_07815 [Phormidium sp.]